MGTGDCAGKMSARLARIFGKDGSQAGQFRLGVRLDEDTVLVGKGTLKQMDWADVDEQGQGYDLILPDSSFKGNQPAFGEHTWDVHLGFVAWSQERRTRLSYQALQWFDPELVEQCIFPRADTQIPVLLEAMKTSEGARQFLKIEREDRDAEVQQTERGELEAADAREPAVLEEVLAADVTGEMIDHPYVQSGLRRRLRQAWHDLAVGGGVKVPAFMGLPDSFRGTVDWLPEGYVVCPDLPPGEVMATRYPIRTRHDVQIWHNVDWQTVQQAGPAGRPRRAGPGPLLPLRRQAQGRRVHEPRHGQAGGRRLRRRRLPAHAGDPPQAAGRDPEAQPRLVRPGAAGRPGAPRGLGAGDDDAEGQAPAGHPRRPGAARGRDRQEPQVAGLGRHPARRASRRVPARPGQPPRCAAPLGREQGGTCRHPGGHRRRSGAQPGRRGRDRRGPRL